MVKVGNKHISALVKVKKKLLRAPFMALEGSLFTCLWLVKIHLPYPAICHFHSCYTCIYSHVSKLIGYAHYG